MNIKKYVMIIRAEATNLERRGEKAKWAIAK